jgi:hypothetical protein
MKQTKNIWTVVCKKAIVDSQSQLISLIDIVEKFSLDVDIEKAPEEIRNSFKTGVFEPAIQVSESMTIASYWFLQDKHRGVDLEVEIVINDSDKKQIASGVVKFTTQNEHKNHRTFVNFPTFPITGSGIYSIIATLKDNQGKVLANSETPVEIVVNTASLS